MERWSGKRDEIKKKEKAEGWLGFEVSEKSLWLSLRAAPCVPRSPFREVSGNVPIMAGRVPHIFPRLSERSPLFFHPCRGSWHVPPIVSMMEVENVLKTFATGPLPETRPIPGWICNARRPRWNGLRSEMSSIMTDLSWISIHLVVTSSGFLSLKEFLVSCIQLPAYYLFEQRENLWVCRRLYEDARLSQK